MARNELIEARLTYSVIGAFFEVYNRLGYGFYESIYANALEIELKARGHQVAREVGVQIHYKGYVIGIQRLDLVVDEKLVVESKATHDLQKGAGRQVYSYLHATHFEVALLLHFGPLPKFYRFVSRDAKEYPSNQPCPANPNGS